MTNSSELPNGSESVFVRHLPCENCGSTDANSLYTDNHQFCFSCQAYVAGDGEEPATKSKKRMEGLITGDFRPLLKRKITEETARKFGYQVGEYKGKTVQIAPYFDASGVMVAQKARFPDKEFTVVGDGKAIGGLLFGQNLWAPGGKKIVVTEGEIDAMSVSQAQGNKWPVVSVPNGAQGAKKSLQKSIEYLESFDEVVLMLDQDEAGKKAAAECAELFSPGKCKIASLPMKDANELLVAGREQDIITAIWQAKSYRPDGLVNAKDLREEIIRPTEMGLPWFLDELTRLTYGRRYGEVYGLGAGTGVGKSDLLTQQIAYDIDVLKMRVGTIFLEQKPTETAKRVAGKLAGKRFHVPDAGWTEAELSAYVDRLGENLVMYDSFGETEWDAVKAKIRFMAVAEGIKLIYVDHLTAMADTADERGSLEQIMKEMAGLANELGIIITFVSHLTTPEGRPHEEGGRVAIRHFKGSRAIGFWSYLMLGLERDQQADDPVVRMTTTLRILKDRYTGQATGETMYLAYDRETGLLSVTEKPEASPFKDETKSDVQSEF
ncbi:DNA primase/helicase [Ralstonia phage P-PSG-11-1]|uniref:DNA helicase/primase n=1 Tax=Ralstonia phage P-PSG-11 TaxID=2652430 RepID=A0A5P8D5P4_9CAUD|nr:DNA primase/helicase [Ralstonia phage P-PSG-11]QFP93760.1 DNA primase/helicase [Ralstonia phage P-PSG-11-1]